MQLVVQHRLVARLVAHPLPAAAVIFFAAVLITMTFWRLLPEALQINESNDFQRYYGPVARNLLAGEGLTLDGAPATEYPPGYPLILAGLAWSVRPLSIPATTALNAFALLCAGLSAALVYLWARVIWGGLPALIPAILWMTYPFYLWLTKQPNSELPFLVLLPASFGMLWYGLLRSGRPTLFILLAGFLAGIAMLIRPIALGIPLVMGMIVFTLPRKLSGRQKAWQALLVCLGALVIVLPWQTWLYGNTGRVILLSTRGTHSILDGLIFVADTQVPPVAPLPADVNALMDRFIGRGPAQNSFGTLLPALLEEALVQPVAMGKLLLIKAVRSWYATDSARFEGAILLVQLPYLIMSGVAAFLALRRSGCMRRQAMALGLIVLYFWFMTTIVLSIVRYMTPTMAALFLLTPILIPGARESTCEEGAVAGPRVNSE